MLDSVSINQVIFDLHGCGYIAPYPCTPFFFWRWRYKNAILINQSIFFRSCFVCFLTCKERDFSRSIMYFTWKKSVFLSSALALSYAKKVKSTIVDSSIIHIFYKRLTKIRRGKDNFAQSNCAEYYFRQRDNDKRNENGNARLLAVKSFLVFLFSFSACFSHKRFSHNTL